MNISVFGIEGSDCNMNLLGKIADKTGGSTNIVKPIELRRQMRQIIDNPIVATEAELRILISKPLGFRNVEYLQEGILLKQDKTYSSLLQPLGSVTTETDITYELNVEETKNKEANMQVHIYYKQENGEERLRIINKTLRITSKRENSLDDSTDVSVIALNSVLQSARLAELSLFREARLKLLSVNKFLETVATTDEQQEEMHSFATNSSELDEDLRKYEKLKSVNSDKVSSLIFRMKKSSLTTFLCGRKKREIALNRKNHTNVTLSQPASNITVEPHIDESVFITEDWLEGATVQEVKEQLHQLHKMQEEIREKQEQSTCVVCMDREINVVLIPCGHLIMCNHCAESLASKKCPTCRQTISQVVKVYNK